MITPRKGKIRIPDIAIGETPISTGARGRIVIDLTEGKLYADSGEELLELGRLMESIQVSQEQVTGDSDEQASWDTPSTLLANLKRIRYVLSQITGSTWSSVAASLSWLKGKFHASSGHVHSGSTDDAPPVPWGNISEKPTSFPPEGHSTSHIPGGSDALPTAAPSGGLGTSNQVGTSSAFARADHVHLAFDSINPAAVASSASPGSATVAARRDHVHNLADGVVSQAKIADGAVSDAKIGNRTISDTSSPTGDTGTLTTLLGWIGYMLKSITGKSNWRTAPAISLESLASHASRHASGGADQLSPSAIGAMPLSGGEFTGIVTAYRNTSYGTGQVRNIYLSTSDPGSSDGGNGDVWIKYTT